MKRTDRYRSDPQVAEFVRSQVALYAPMIGQDIIDAFREQLAEGLALGEDIATLQNRLMQFADLQAPARALRVARTEIADAQNAGAQWSLPRRKASCVSVLSAGGQTKSGSDMIPNAELDVVLCSGCKKNAANEPHACPYAQELDGSTDNEYCTCCDECTYQCAMDI